MNKKKILCKRQITDFLVKFNITLFSFTLRAHMYTYKRTRTQESTYDDVVEYLMRFLAFKWNL